jgi:Tol biopolymer transport system component/DNA-binding winged helix-turn-helix (wHTH) protein
MVGSSLGRFHLGGRVVDTAANRITFDKETIQVEPKIMHVLAVLAEHAGEVVTRETLMSSVWSDVFVTDDVLHRAIRELRRMFGDDPDSPHIIETIRKRGYRLIAAVEPIDVAVPAGPAHRTRPDWMPGPLAIIGCIAAATLAGAATVWFGIAAPVRTAEPVRFIPLTNTLGNEVDPALSPSGVLAYVARGADGRSHVFVKAANDPQGVPLTSGEGHEMAPVWSPDDRGVAFVRVTGEECGIWVTDILKRAERLVAPCATRASMKMSWAADGDSLAIAAGGGTPDAPLHLEILSVSTGTRHPVTQPSTGGVGDDSPAFSPDGKQLAFVRSLSSSIGDIYTVSTSGGAGRRVTFDDGDIIGVDWESDGHHLVFSSERGGGISLWRVAATGGEPAFVAGGGAKLKHPSVARRTGAIAFEDWHYEINIVDLPASDGSTGVAGTPFSPTSDQWNFHPQISPDQSRVAFQSTRSGQYEIWIARRDGSNARQMTRSGSYKSAPRWSPDGTRVVFGTRTAETAQLIALNVESGAAETLATDADAVVAPAWSQDGRSVYFGALRNKAWQVSRVGLSGDRPQPLIAGAYAAAESPDGRWLYYVRLHRRGLWRRASGTTDDVLVTGSIQAEDWSNLAIANDGVFIITHPDDSDPQLTFVDAATGASRALTRLPEFAWSGIAMSSDGTRVLYAHADRRESNIVEIARR